MTSLVALAQSVTCVQSVCMRILYGAITVSRNWLFYLFFYCCNCTFLHFTVFYKHLWMCFCHSHGGTWNSWTHLRIDNLKKPSVSLHSRNDLVNNQAGTPSRRSGDQSKCYPFPRRLRSLLSTKEYKVCTKFPPEHMGVRNLPFIVEKFSFCWR